VEGNGAARELFTRLQVPVLLWFLCCLFGFFFLVVIYLSFVGFFFIFLFWFFFPAVRPATGGFRAASHRYPPPPARGTLLVALQATPTPSSHLGTGLTWRRRNLGPRK